MYSNNVNLYHNPHVFGFLITILKQIFFTSISNTNCTDSANNNLTYHPTISLQKQLCVLVNNWNAHMTTANYSNFLTANSNFLTPVSHSGRWGQSKIDQI